MELFKEYGKIDKLAVKKSRNNEYCFAFIEYEKDSNVEEAVNKYINIQM